MQRPEGSSFTRFLLSLGVFLCVAAFVLPGFVLRDNEGLLVSQEQLNGLTEVGRTEILRRQDTAQTFGKAVVPVGVVLFFAGLALIRYALPRSREHEALEVDRLKQELQPQSAVEVVEGLEREAEELKDAGGDQGEAGARSPGRLGVRPVVDDGVGRIAGVEEKVLDRIRSITPMSYELQRHVLVGAGSGIGLDGLLVRPAGDGPDVLIEIKLATLRVRIQSRAEAGVRSGAEALARYREITGREAVCWVVVVTEADVSMAQRVDVEQGTMRPSEGIFLSVVPEGQLQTLSLPFLVGR